jgi:hypothetical protein
VRPQFLTLLHPQKDCDLKTLQGYSIDYILFHSTLIRGRTSPGFDHRLNSSWHTLNQVIPPVIPKFIPNLNNNTLHRLHRGNVTIYLCDSILHVSPNFLNGVEIRGIWGVLMALHPKLHSDRNTPFNALGHCPPSQLALEHL